MTADQGLALTTLCWVLAAVPSLLIAGDQAILMIRLLHRHDGLDLYRVRTALLFGVIGVALARSASIWADFRWFDQRYFGTIDDRWPMDLAISVVLLLAVLLSTCLYLRARGARPPS